MNELLTAGWFKLLMPALATLLFLAAAFALTGLIRANKGARINRAWGLAAFGSACLGLASLDAVLQAIGAPNAAAARGALTTLGALFLALGAVQARGIYRGLLK